MQYPYVEFSFQAFNRFLSNAGTLPILHAHWKADDPIMLKKEFYGEAQRFTDTIQNLICRADQAVLKFGEIGLRHT